MRDSKIAPYVGRQPEPVLTSLPRRVLPGNTRSELELLRLLNLEFKLVEATFAQLAEHDGRAARQLLEMALRPALKMSEGEFNLAIGSDAQYIELEKLRQRALTGSHRYTLDVQARNSLVKLLTFTFAAMPVMCLAVAAVFGGLLSLVEPWPFRQCFFLVAKELSDLDMALAGVHDSQWLHPRAIELGFGGRLGVAITNMISIAFFGLILGVTGGPLLGPFLSFLGLAHGNGTELTICESLRKLVCLMFLVAPLVAVIISVMFGSLLSLVEEWEFQDAFWLILQEITDSKLQLVDPHKVQITSDSGRLLMVVVALWSLSLFVTVVGMIAGPLIHPLLDVMRLSVLEPDLPDGDDHAAAHIIGSESEPFGASIR